MAGTPRVQLSLKGRLLSEVAFAGPQLRIGRMRENDVVVNNLAVSRFHATLRREGEGFVLEDLGSENGTQLNGERISGSVAIQPSDVIQLGKYELRIALQPGVPIAGPPKAKANDAWDSSQTFLAMEPAPPAAAKGGKASPAPAAPERAVSDLRAASAAPDPDGVFAFGEDDLAADAIEPARAADVETGPLTPPNPEHTSLFDFGGPAAPELAAPEAAAPAAAPSSDAGESATPSYAGLIVQREGKLHLLRPWESGELCAGRAPECEIVLADAGVSRRHALFSNTAEGHAVRDLGSVNGIYVNGQRTKQHVLAVGDVVRIESFELTFVLDRQPIGSEVSGPTPSPVRPQETGRATQFSLEAPAFENEEAFDLAPLAGDPAHAPGAASDAPFEANTDGFDAFPAPDEAFAAVPVSAPGPEAALPEADLMTLDGSEDDEEKDATVQAAAGAQALGFAAALATRGAVQLRLRLDSAQLSVRAREALAVLAEEGVELSARISFERET